MRRRLHRFVYALLLIWGVVSVVFLLFQALGDPAGMLAGQTGDPETIQNIKKELHLDQPIWKQYLFYLNDLSPISVHNREEIEKKEMQGYFLGENKKIGIKIPYLGTSFQSGRKVTEILMDALPGTLLLASLAIILASLLGISLGTLAAVNHHSALDRLVSIVGIAGVSAPSFLLALLIALIFGYWLHPLTGLPMTGNWKETDAMTGQSYAAYQNWILPALSLGIRPMAIIMQMTRSSMIDVMQQDYIRTAKAKGLPKSSVIIRHALPNAINPVITAISGWFAELLAGAFFIEFIFGWQGLGKVTVDALEKLDYPVLMGAVLITAIFFMLISRLTDRVYRLVDPRIRVG